MPIRHMTHNPSGQKQPTLAVRIFTCLALEGSKFVLTATRQIVKHLQLWASRVDSTPLRQYPCDGGVDAVRYWLGKCCFGNEPFYFQNETLSDHVGPSILPRPYRNSFYGATDSTRAHRVQVVLPTSSSHGT